MQIFCSFYGTTIPPKNVQMDRFWFLELLTWNCREFFSRNGHPKMPRSFHQTIMDFETGRPLNGDIATWRQDSCRRKDNVERYPKRSIVSLKCFKCIIKHVSSLNSRIQASVVRPISHREIRTTTRYHPNFPFHVKFPPRLAKVLVVCNLRHQPRLNN